MDTRYEILEAMKIFTKLSSDGQSFQKLIQTGQLNIHDYETGFIDLLIYPYEDYKHEYFVRLSFTTIDDGDFGAWKKVNSWNEALGLSRKIANEVFKDMVAFPTKEELNEKLKPYEIVVDYEY